MPKILITGALGQIGRVLVQQLVDKHGAEAVLATDLPFDADLPCKYKSLDATDVKSWAGLIKQYQFTEIYHLVAVLSAKGEANPWRSWDINMVAWKNVIESAIHWPNCKIFFPSSIAVYGPPLPNSVDENQVLTPTTSYGVSKVAGELWADYAAQRFDLDIRCLRLPGVIGYRTMPGGGTTDFAVDIFHRALATGNFNCFLAADTRLPMIFMPDLMRGILELMDTPRAVLTQATRATTIGKYKELSRSTSIFNLNGFSVTPAELAQEISKHIPSFTIAYTPDFRQDIARSWPQELDGQKAKDIWGWEPAFDLVTTTKEMLLRLSQNKKQPSKKKI